MSPAAGLRGVQGWLRHLDDVDLELACTEHPAPEAGPAGRSVVRLTTCAAAVPVHELVELLLLGADRVRVRLDGCGDADGARAHLAPVLGVLAAAGVDRLSVSEAAAAEPATGSPGLRRLRHPRGLRRRPVLDAGHMPLPRRQVLGLPGRPGRDLPGEHLDPQERLVAAVRALVPDGAAGLDTLASPAPRLAAQGCTACGVCVQACPADVLRLRHAGGVTTLLHEPAGCDGCGDCVAMCPQDVLTQVGTWPWADVLAGPTAAVTTLMTARCERCRTRFPTTSGDRLCPVCRYRRANPFGSSMPPGVLAGAGR
ncbi:4Fe-4S dicluster domain-containing protein [Georgenia yuyongxinii]|uniref:4Fe-4S dicluster domain-containing protein n=1 Tax=Georgenia yuyongxinii TaxID=2589797 RepID=A0A5B8C5Y2_9MICO|nr:4Fe-4S dicluster domain-containing protein [Georgenia yuyongxinii]QDC25510.1 4Fe-4S dicluster domain-containing protein [Georgenia yuyongxinii]